MAVCVYKVGRYRNFGLSHAHQNACNFDAIEVDFELEKRPEHGMMMNHGCNACLQDLTNARYAIQSEPLTGYAFVPEATNPVGKGVTL